MSISARIASLPHFAWPTAHSFRSIQVTNTISQANTTSTSHARTSKAMHKSSPSYPNTPVSPSKYSAPPPYMRVQSPGDLSASEPQNSLPSSNGTHTTRAQTASQMATNTLIMEYRARSMIGLPSCSTRRLRTRGLKSTTRRRR
jgi:hypothetical protein